jgi:hypothetical protein
MAANPPTTRVSLLTTREVRAADGSLTRIGMPVAIDDDDDGLDPAWPTLPIEERWRQIFALLELSMDFRDLSSHTLCARHVDRTVNVLDFRQEVQH